MATGPETSCLCGRIEVLRVLSFFSYRSGFPPSEASNAKEQDHRWVQDHRRKGGGLAETLPQHRRPGERGLGVGGVPEEGDPPVGERQVEAGAVEEADAGDAGRLRGGDDVPDEGAPPGTRLVPPPPNQCCQISYQFLWGVPDSPRVGHTESFTLSPQTKNIRTHLKRNKSGSG